MLQAKNKYEELVTLATLPMTEILSLKKQLYRCPTCNEPVIIKAGAKVVPHFAHCKNTSCPAREGGEGAYHEKGKLLLYQWLLNQGLDVQLEVYLPEIQQRPDILVIVNRKKIAIEYQCARISTEEILSRNNGYKKHGIIPLWIIGAKNLQRCGTNDFKIDTFQLHFIHRFSTALPATFYYFCPDSLQFSMIQDSYYYTNTKAIAKFYVKKLNEITFTDIFRDNFFTEAELYFLWKKQKRLFRIKLARAYHGHELIWQQWLYRKGLYKAFLPSVIHLPVSGQIHMNVPPWNWQGRICLDIIDPLPEGTSQSVQTCIHLLRHQNRPSKSFPLVKEPQNPIKQYLKLLEQLQLISFTSAGHFTKRRPLKFHQTVDDAISGDNRLVHYCIANKIRA